MAKTTYIVDYFGRRHKQTEYDTDDFDTDDYPDSEEDSEDDQDLEEVEDHELDKGDETLTDGDEDLDPQDDSDSEEELEVVPQKLPAKPRKSSTQRAASRPSNNETTTPGRKSRKTKSKSKHVTPGSEIVAGDSSTVSPVSDEFNSNKSKRRQAAVNNMATSAKIGRERSKKRTAELEADNNSKERELKKLRKEAKKLQENLQIAQRQPQEPELPLPKSRTIRKKGRSVTKAAGSNGSKRGVTLDGFVKQKAKQQFRHTKFVMNEEQFRDRIGNPVMDALEINELHHLDGETDLQRAQVEAYRDKFFNEWVNVMASGYNETRNYRQGRVKEACFKWMTDNNRVELFPTEDLEIVMKRDFSSWEPKMNDEGEAVTPGDPEKLAYYHELMDFYVDELVPAVCSHRDFKPSVRHFVPLCDARFVESGDEELDGQVIVTPGTEALILLFIKNARKKWEMMYNWEVTQGKTDKKKHPFPKWSPKYPEKNVDWKTLYSDSASGQNPFAGWKIRGLKEYNSISAMMDKVREDVELCRYQDTLTMKRLFEEHKDDYAKDDTKKHVDKDDDDPDTLEMFFEDPAKY